MKDTFDKGFYLAEYLKKNNYMIVNLFPKSLDHITTANIYNDEGKVKTVLYFDFSNHTLSCVHHNDQNFYQFMIDSIMSFSVIQGYKKPLSYNRRENNQFLFNQQETIDRRLRIQDRNYQHNTSYYLSIVDKYTGAINIDEIHYDTVKQILEHLHQLEKSFYKGA